MKALVKISDEWHIAENLLVEVPLSNVSGIQRSDI